jgi:DIS3-like exonuclease 2
VSYFLEENTELDMEARLRATSTYLIQKVIPMLPPILCEKLCSLIPNVDRLAFSCIWQMNSDGSLSNKPVWYGKTIIRSCAKLDYPTAQRMIDGIIPSKPSSDKNNPDSFLSSLGEIIWEKHRHPIGHSAWECSRDVCRMHMIAMNRRKERLSNGALSLNKPKLSFKLDKNGNPCDLSSYIIRESNQLVEEYMLLANYLVAQELIIKVGKAAFLRNHPLPKMKELDELKVLCTQLDLDIDTTSAKSLQKSLQKIISTVSPEISQAITSLLTHPMNLAQYLVADSSPSAGWSHYALAIPYYTHFTSPIRRYADVMVHRLLFLGLNDENAMEKSGKIEKINEFSGIAHNCNERKKSAKEAQEQSATIFLSVYLIKNPMEVNAIVIGIGEKSFSILIPDYGIEKRLFIDDMIGVTSVFDDNNKKLILIRNIGGTARDSKDAFGRDRKMIDNNDNGNCLSNKMKFDKLDIHVMETLVVFLSSIEKPHLDVCVTIVRSGKVVIGENRKSGGSYGTSHPVPPLNNPNSSKSNSNNTIRSRSNKNTNNTIDNNSNKNSNNTIYNTTDNNRNKNSNKNSNNTIDNNRNKEKNDEAERKIIEEAMRGLTL